MAKKPQEALNGIVMCCGKNIFSVKCIETGNIYKCNIKGKVLKVDGAYYNPLCPGDRIQFSVCGSASTGGAALAAGVDTANGAALAGLLLSVEKRGSVFSRYNEKGRCTQLLAANIDQVVLISSCAHPPFRPRFIDRVLVQCEKSGLPPVLVLNKIDLKDCLEPCPPDDSTESVDDYAGIERRLARFESLGCAVLRVSAVNGAGLADLRRILKNKRSVFTGQSGAGKSTLINAVLPGALQKTGALAVKYDRGAHTTVMGCLLEGAIDGEHAGIIDTPGLRRFVPDGISPDDLLCYMPDMAPFLGRCLYGGSCTHTHEQGCAFLEARRTGHICEDRWTSFLSLRKTLLALRAY
ncbi:MAG: ribosome small subunit-dependent GTPase A [Spirochaetaceae bacterium]|jgi:ribosome biogenesis GTPase|nr:ribosome small subunit-dependent GTPase A [Spirochaetaceae bacterium]